jgi:hypothetical protein
MKKYFRLLTLIVFISLVGCASPQKTEMANVCTVSIYQGDSLISGSNALDGVTIYNLKNKSFTIKVPNADCKPSIGVFSVFEKMRSIGASKGKVFTTSGFEMASNPEKNNELPIARDAERIAQKDFYDIFGSEGVKNYQSICKIDGKCPIPLVAFRSYSNFLGGSNNQQKNSATINPVTSKPINLMVYTEEKRMPRTGSNGNWPADIVLQPHPLLIILN